MRLRLAIPAMMIGCLPLLNARDLVSQQIEAWDNAVKQAKAL